MIDSHTHIYMEEFDSDRNEVIHRAVSNGVHAMILPNVDLDSIEALHNTVAQYPSHCHAAMGLHPTSVTPQYADQLASIRPLFDTNTYCAVGEIGIDLYWDKTYCDEQCRAFAEQIRWAQELHLPIIIHCREALDTTIGVLKQFPYNSVRGVFHSFTGTPEQVETIRREVGDFYFGINGIVTFKNARLDDLITAIGIDRILLETDAPYLAPTPHRGKRNEPAYIPYMAARIAQILGCSIEEVDKATTANTRTLFNL
ncbi:MAG: TatD family hydrolase [Bacteroidales bacterium]|nr:TatD family hydrolase [Bacteroidales bacterium]